MYTKQSDYVYFLGSYDIGNPTQIRHDWYQLYKQKITQIIAKVSVNDLLSENLKNFEILMTSHKVTATKKQTKNSKSLVWLTIDFIESHSNDYSPHPIVPETIAEGSLHYNIQSNQWIITSLDIFQSNIRICSSYSDRIDDIWTCQVVSGIEQRWSNSQNYLTYAGKSHPEFLNQQQLNNNFLVSLLNNSTTTFNNNTSQNNLNRMTHHGILSYVANPTKGPVELFQEGERDSYCPTFLYY